MRVTFPAKLKGRLGMCVQPNGARSQSSDTSAYMNMPRGLLSALDVDNDLIHISRVLTSDSLEGPEGDNEH